MGDEYDFFENFNYFSYPTKTDLYFHTDSEEDSNNGKKDSNIDKSNNTKDYPKNNENIPTKTTSKKTDNKSILSVINVKTQKNGNIKFITKKISNKKRGRSCKKKSNKIHSKNDLDNVQTKIQRYFLNYLINRANSITNIVLDEKINTKHFLRISDKEKINIFTPAKMKKLKYKDIFRLKISKKNKGLKEIYQDGMTNKNNYDDICHKSPILKDYFEQGYLDVFRKNYYINRDEFDFNGKNYILSNQTYKYLLEKNKDTEQKIFEYIIKRDYIQKNL